MHSGPEQMRDWMRRRGFTQADASRYLEMDQGYLSRLLASAQTPGLRLALKLERLTGIPVEAWESSDVNEHVGEDSGSAQKKTA